MRTELERLVGQRIRVRGDVDAVTAFPKKDLKENEKKNYALILSNIRDAWDSNIIYADHIWVPRKDLLEKVRIQPGDIVCMTGEVFKYQRNDSTFDYSIKNATGIWIDFLEHIK